jgi:hypothetical protein
MRLSETQADGATLRDHLLAAAASGAGRDALLDVRPPRGTERLWDAFAALSASRVPESGIAPSEVIAWQRLHGVRLSPWEAETLEAVDRACVAQMRAQAARRRKAKQ